MFCSHCGTEAADGAGFCSNCGRGLASAVATLPEPALADAAPRRPPADPAGALAAAKEASWSQPEGKPFEHEGQWYARQGHGLLRWDAGASAWTEARPAGVVAPRTAFASLKTPALILYILFGVFALLTAVAVVADVLAYSTFDDAANGGFVSQADRDGALTFVYGMKGFQGLVVLGIAGVFIWWTRRATCNVPALGAANPEFSPGWAVGWWFIPFANWVQPLRVLNQAWRASDPALPNVPTDEWRRAKLTPVLPVWWVSYLLLSGIWNGVWSAIDEVRMEFDEVAALALATGVLDAMMLLVTGLTVWVVAALTVRHERANARFKA